MRDEDYYNNSGRFVEKLETIDMSEVKEWESRWGNDYLYITEKEIEELRQGKVLAHNDGEYGHFIVLK